MARGTEVDLKGDPGERMIDKRKAEAPTTIKNTKPKAPRKTASTQAAALEY